MNKITYLKPEQLIKGKWYKGYHPVDEDQWYIKFDTLDQLTIYHTLCVTPHDDYMSKDYGYLYGLTKLEPAEQKTVLKYFPNEPNDAFIDNTFPEKWCIKVPDGGGLNIITEWFNENSQTKSKDYHTYSIGYLHYPAFIFLSSGNICHQDADIYEGYTEITIEQFEQNILKTKNTMQKIIGYKLIDNKYELAAAKLLSPSLAKLYGDISHPDDILKLKEAGVLNLWFEPIYENKFKKGDYVYVVKDSKNGSRSEVTDKVFKFNRYLTNHENKYKYEIQYPANNWVVWEIRKATPEEIESLFTRTVTLSSGKTVIVTKNGVQGEGELTVIPIEKMEELFEPRAFNGYNVQVKTIDIGCWKGLTFDDFIKVKSVYDSLQ